jgi:hypothetical protein
LTAGEDPQLRKVLEQYRGAEIELNSLRRAAAKMNGARSGMAAAASRARDVAWQAQRYMRIERSARPEAARLHGRRADEPFVRYSRHTG